MRDDIFKYFEKPQLFIPRDVSPIERDFLLGRGTVEVARATEQCLLESKVRLSEEHNPNPQATYVTEMLQLALQLCQKYNPVDVEAVMKKYEPDLFPKD